MQKDKLTLLRRELAHVRSSGRLSFYRATARDRAGFTCEVAWYHKLEDSLAYQQAGNLLHATQIASKVQKRCIRRKIFHSQCNAISQTSQKELCLCRNSPKNVAKQENIATLSLISMQKRCFGRPNKSPWQAKPLFPHTVEILYLFGILRINTRVSGMLACRYPCAFISGSGAGIPKRYKISA